MGIKQIQMALNVTVDDSWGNQSQTALLNSDKNLGYDWEKMRANFGKFSQSQVDGFNAILTAVNGNASAKNPVYLAYMLATAWHETAKKMQPIEEYGKGRGRKYGQCVDMNGKPYKGNQLYYGRGYVQLTWINNYQSMAKICNADLVNCPELALEPENAANIMIYGMLNGMFTGKSLSSYIKAGSYNEYVNARHVINGSDCADKIAGYAVKFLDCLVLA